MPRSINPKRILPPGARYSHGIIHSARARRLVMSAQYGTQVDGTVPEDLREQIAVAFDNLLAVIAEAGFSTTDLVKLSAYCTVPHSIRTYREVRDRKLDGHAPTSTYMEVTGLAMPALKFQVEGEAVSEDPDLLFDDFSEQVAAPEWRGKR
jgi:enamine deaminase RidA (YjgF/YER057c/UK114 family)